MNKAAIQHTCSAPFAYPVGPDHLRVVLRAARGDLSRVEVICRDRYAPESENQTLPLSRWASDLLADYWTAVLPERRAGYGFHLVAVDGEEAWYNEQGFWAAPPQSGFMYPYIAPADRIALPDWLDEGAVFYQIFPDRFANGDGANDPPGTVPWGSTPTPHDLQGGDLKGILQHLDHLGRLGVGGLYMTPVFESSSNHKYNTRDYYKVDPAFGDENDLKQLVTAAHERGIRVLLDAVFNHAGDDFSAFVDCIKKGSKSRYWNWFNIQGDAVRTDYPCNYETFGTHLAWMPKLMTQNPETAAYLLDVAEYWIREAGIDGWRLDVANEVDHAFWRAFRQRVKAANREAWILGEIWHDSSDWLRGDQFDSVMNYPFRDAILAFFQHGVDVERFDGLLAQARLRYPWDVTANLLTLLGTHDTPRIRTLIGREKAALATTMMLTYPGVPLIYYGDEVGMEGGADPGCRGAMDWSEASWDKETLALHRKLVQVRRAFPWLRDGDYHTIVSDAAQNVFGFKRTAALAGVPGKEDREGVLFTLVNNGPAAGAVTLATTEPLVDLLSGERVPTGERLSAGESTAVTLQPWQARVLVPAAQAARAGLG